MISNKMYELAFEYKKTKLWKRLYDTDVFAVKFSDGKIGYISIMGMANEHIALGLYIGEDGFNSLRVTINSNNYIESFFEFQDILFQQNCLQCSFENKDELSETELAQVREYTRSHGIKAAGRNFYPKFSKYSSGLYPWYIQKEEDQRYICEALSAAIEIAKLLNEYTVDSLGLTKIDNETKDILMLEFKNGEYIQSRTKLPKEKPREYPTPKADNDIGVLSIKKIKKKVVLQCEIVRFPEPVQDKPEDIPAFPTTLIAIEPISGMAFSISPVMYYDNNPEELLNLFINALITEKVCPSKIKVRDECTLAFVKALCSKLKIEAEFIEELPELEMALDTFWKNIYMDGDDELEMMTDMLEMIFDSNNKEVLDNIPDDVRNDLETLMEKNIFSSELTDKINIALNGCSQPKPVKNNSISVLPASNNSYVISVSIGTGCYRHIQISGESTLLELSYTILDAFEFDDDHAHAFFMNDKIWSNKDAYYLKGMEDGYKTTEKFRLNQFNLQKGTKFKYLFDFGDEWVFQCKVLRIEDKITKEPIVIKAKGKAPEQYPEWKE